MARPKGSGQGLVNVGCRLEPDVYEAFEIWRKNQIDPEHEEPISQSEAMRLLLRWALEERELLERISVGAKGYMEGLRRGRADFHQALRDAWDKIEREGGK